jgi:hypothetical protein
VRVVIARGVVDDRAQPRPERLDRRDDVTFIEVVCHDVQGQFVVGFGAFEEVEQQCMRLESQPAVDTFAAFVLQRRLLEVQPILGVGGNDVGIVAELLAVGLRGREVTGEPDVDKAVVGDRLVLDVHLQLRAGLQLVVGRHVLFGDAVGIGAINRLGRKVDPPELLERRLK